MKAGRDWFTNRPIERLIQQDTLTEYAGFEKQDASVIDSLLLRYTLATNHAQDQRIIEQTERGRTLSCRMRGFLPTEEHTRVIRTQLAGGPPSTEGLDQNLALYMLSVREEGSGAIVIHYQALKPLDWLGTHYQGELRELANIMVDFDDGQGFLIRTDRFPARRTATGDDVMNPVRQSFSKSRSRRSQDLLSFW